MMRHRITRPFATLLLLRRAAWKKFGADNCTQMAAAMGYYALFALVPLAAFSLSAFAAVLGTARVQSAVSSKMIEYLGSGFGDVQFIVRPEAQPELEARLGPAGVTQLDDALKELNTDSQRQEERRNDALALHHGQAVTVGATELVASELTFTANGPIADAIRSYIKAKGSVWIVSLLLMLLASSIIFSSINRSLNYIWGAGASRAMLHQKALDVAMLVVVGTLLLVSLGVSSLIGWLQQLLEDNAGELLITRGTLFSALLFLIPLLISFFFCLVAYRYIPRARHTMADVWPGAILGALSLEVLKLGWVNYISRFTSYSTAYGSLGTLLVLLFLTYLAFYGFLLGAEVACVWPSVRDGTYEASAAELMADAAASRRRGILAILGGIILGLIITNRHED